jgi:hypothetical protein
MTKSGLSARHHHLAGLIELEAPRFNSLPKIAQSIIYSCPSLLSGRGRCR